MPDFCPSCNENQIKFVTKRSGINIVSCKSCSLTFVKSNTQAESANDPIMTDPNFYHAIDTNYETQLELARMILPGRIAEYEKLLGRRLSSVIEVGCATGAYARAFDELGVAYTGVEIEDDIAKKARDRTGMNIISADLMDLKFKNSFDLFFCSQVVEHVKDPTAFISRASALCDNGLVHVDVPNHDSLTSKIRKIYHPNHYGFIQPSYHMIAYNQKSLSKLYSRCNLEILQCKPVSNDDMLWGQLVISPTGINKLIYLISSQLNLGSLLTAIGRSPSWI